MTWELREVDDVECTMDDSGVYVVVHRVISTETHKQYAGDRVRVRADLMGGGFATGGETNAEPIMSFIGSANAVRKALIQFVMDHIGFCQLSMEHASYIGYELLRAEAYPAYVQD